MAEDSTEHTTIQKKESPVDRLIEATSGTPPIDYDKIQRGLYVPKLPYGMTAKIGHMAEFKKSRAPHADIDARRLEMQGLEMEVLGHILHPKDPILKYEPGEDKNMFLVTLYLPIGEVTMPVAVARTLIPAIERMREPGSETEEQKVGEDIDLKPVLYEEILHIQEVRKNEKTIVFGLHGIGTMSEIVHGAYELTQLMRMAVMCKAALEQDKTLIIETTARLTNDPERGSVAPSAELYSRFLERHGLPPVEKVGYLNREIPTAIMVGTLDKNAQIKFLQEYATFADQAALKITTDKRIEDEEPKNYTALKETLQET